MLNLKAASQLLLIMSLLHETMQGNPFQRQIFQLSNISKSTEDRDKLGRTALETFISNRMVDKKIQFWSPQKMNNFLYFKDIGATVQAKINGQLLSIKKEESFFLD